MIIEALNCADYKRCDYMTNFYLIIDALIIVTLI